MIPYYHEHEDLHINNGIGNFPLFFSGMIPGREKV
jgi:hypothetical protein